MAGTTNVGGGGPAGDVSFNYIPLIDVTFNLIIFFVLTSEISSERRARVLIPNPYQPQAAAAHSKAKGNSVVLSVTSEAKDVADLSGGLHHFRYEINGMQVEDIRNLEDVAQKIKQQQLLYEKIAGKPSGSQSDFFVEIRADSRLGFQEVSPVIQAIAGAGIRNIAISTKRAAS
jgi:biopolymer transport protein ExbD